MNIKPRKSAGQIIMTVIGIILCIVLLPLLIANITIIVESFVSPNEVPGFLGYKPFIDLSDSMYPAIKAGDLVIVQPADPNKLVAGDIISYREGKSVITHRIVRVVVTNGNRQFVTKGDNNNIEDVKMVSPSSLEGKFLLDIPKLGNGALFMQTPLGMVLFIALPLLLFILYDVIRRRINERQRQKVTDPVQFNRTVSDKPLRPSRKMTDAEKLEMEINKMRQRISELENEKESQKNDESRINK